MEFTSTIKKYSTQTFYFKKILLYIEGYVAELPCCLLHEFSHYVVTSILWVFGVSSFPKFVWSRFYGVTINKDNTIETRSHSIYIEQDMSRKYGWCLILSLIAPAITTILLFIFSPIYMYLYYVPNISSLWMSVSDIAKSAHIIKAHKRAFKINKLKKLRNGMD